MIVVWNMYVFGYWYMFGLSLLGNVNKWEFYFGSWYDLVFIVSKLYLLFVL